MYEERMSDLFIRHDGSFVTLCNDGERIPYKVSMIGWGNYDGDSSWVNYDTDDYPTDSVPASECVFRLVEIRPYIPNNNTTQSEIDVKYKDISFTHPEYFGNVEIGHVTIFIKQRGNVCSPYKYRSSLHPEGLSGVTRDSEHMDMVGIDLYNTYTSYQAIQALYNGQGFSTVGKAINVLRSRERLSCALSQVYSIHIPVSGTGYSVAREGLEVGRYNTTSKVVLLSAENSMFKEELVELGMSVEILDQVNKCDNACTDIGGGWAPAQPLLDGFENTWSIHPNYYTDTHEGQLEDEPTAVQYYMGYAHFTEMQTIEAIMGGPDA